MIHSPRRHECDQGCKLGSLCIRFSSDVILGLRKETGYRPGWRSGGHRAEGWPLCCSRTAQPAPEGHLLVPGSSAPTLKYESIICPQPLRNDLESFRGIQPAFVTTWSQLVSLDVILSLYLQRGHWQAFKNSNFLIEICDLRRNGCCGGAQLLTSVCKGPYRPQMRIQESRLSYTATPKPPNLRQLVSAPHAPNGGARATPSGQKPQLRHIL